MYIYICIRYYHLLCCRSHNPELASINQYFHESLFIYMQERPSSFMQKRASKIGGRAKRAYQFVDEVRFNIKNAIVKVDVAEVETRSDKRGRFSLDFKYNKKNAPYILKVTPLAHKQYQETLEFGKELELSTKLTLQPKPIYLPYKKSSIDMENQGVLNLMNVKPAPASEKPPEEPIKPTEATEQTTPAEQPVDTEEESSPPTEENKE